MLVGSNGAEGRKTVCVSLEGFNPLASLPIFTDVKSRLDFYISESKGIAWIMGILYVERKYKHGEIIKAEFDTFGIRKKTQGVNGWDYKGTTNANPVNDIQTKISSLISAAHENELRLAVPSCHGRAHIRYQTPI